MAAPNPRAHLKSVTAAVTVHVQSAAYNPPSLPITPQDHWPSMLDESSVNTLFLEERLAAGKEVLKSVLFTLVSEMQAFRGRPPAFTQVRSTVYFAASKTDELQIICDAVSSRDVLREILFKTDPEVANLGEEEIESGFHYLVGYLWGRASEEIKYLTPTVRPMFAPLLPVAATAYDAYQHRPATVKKLQQRDLVRKDGIVTFLKKVKAHQAPHLENLHASSYAKPESAVYCSRSSPEIVALDLDTVTCLNPALLARRQPPSPSTPRQSFLPLPQPYGRGPYAVRTSPHTGELALSAGFPWMSEGCTGVWASLASPSGLEAELMSLNLSFERPGFKFPRPRCEQ
ncbi:hypothetical protein MSAN_00671200 [Mycena sanguinolenta]|uniref:Uncharacterized protein n=1 Tax=Mycena sanguinolenta TaxID=230812 RepID=A0A8H6Z3Z3_9AGAR|nr:hypothetical protein MSAN_00671200 [Mycena sanguinolenta]